jgi:PAS domain S-box-containing protein
MTDGTPAERSQTVGSELRLLLARKDWSRSPLGPREQWSPALKIAVDMILSASFPMALRWGPEFVIIYNDGYRPILGDKHPAAFGLPFREVWPEVQAQLAPLHQAMLDGKREAQFSQDLPLNIQRRGNEWETAYFTVSYSPVPDDTLASGVGGILVTAVETTGRIRTEQALRASEERFQFALEAAGGVGTWDWDLQNNLIYADVRFARMFSIDPARAAAGVAIDEFIAGIHPDDRARASAKIQLTIETAADFAEEYRLLRQDGSLCWVFARGRSYQDDEGRPLRFPGIAIDITERKRTEDELYDSRERLNTIVTQATVGIAQTDIHGVFLLVNDRFCEITGHPRATLLGHAMREFTHPDDLPGNLAAVDTMMATGEPFVIEKRYLRADGSPVWVNNHISLTRDAQGAPQYTIAVVQDITARKYAEEALRKLNETLELQVAERTRERDRLWRVSGDLLAVAAADGGLISVNPAWTRVLGWTEAELMEMSYSSLRHPDDHEASWAEHVHIADGRRAVRFDSRFNHKDGTYRWISWTGISEDGVIYVLGRDVTVERGASESLRQIEEALRQSQKMEAVGQLTGGLAHDFNNILTGIVGSLDLLQTRIGQGRVTEAARYIKSAMTSAHRAAALTHRLLAFARRQPLDPKPLDVNRLIGSMEELLRRSIGERIAIELVAAGGLWPTYCDPNQLENVLLNLAINARDAMPEGGRLTIETTNTHLDDAYAARIRDVSRGQYICLSVTDTGTGMTPDVIARAFDPFFTTKPIGQGTGLGLSMVYGFAKQSNGHARIYSEVGQGTTIKLYLPRYRGQVEDDDVANDIDERPGGEGEIVLVIEDDPVVRELVVEILQESGYRTLQAGDGPAGLKIIRSGQRIDLLVTDVGLPGMNGRQFADAARLERPELKVLFVTGYAENAALASGFLEHGMTMITKPFAVDLLIERVREMITGERS